MKKIIIDCDPGIDDSIALIYAILSNKFEKHIEFYIRLLYNIGNKLIKYCS